MDMVKKAVREAGLELSAVYEACSRKAPGTDSERIYYVAREVKKAPGMGAADAGELQ